MNEQLFFVLKDHLESIWERQFPTYAEYISYQKEYIETSHYQCISDIALLENVFCTNTNCSSKGQKSVVDCKTVQTRSADEGASQAYICIKCGRKWYVN